MLKGAERNNGVLRPHTWARQRLQLTGFDDLGDCSSPKAPCISSERVLVGFSREPLGVCLSPSCPSPEASSVGDSTVTRGLLGGGSSLDGLSELEPFRLPELAESPSAACSSSSEGGTRSSSSPSSSWESVPRASTASASQAFPPSLSSGCGASLALAFVHRRNFNPVG